MMNHPSMESMDNFYFLFYGERGTLETMNLAGGYNRDGSIDWWKENRMYNRAGKMVLDMADIASVMSLTGEVKALVVGTVRATAAEGGLNLFKWKALQTETSLGWKAGDRMLYLPDKGTPALNWKANYGALRREMALRKPIFDSFREANGQLIKTGGFLNAERAILSSRGWIYSPVSKAWLPPLY